MIMAFVTDSVMPWTSVTSLTDASGNAVKWYTGATLDLAMGKVGVIFVAIAVMMGIFTGMNGFYMSGSRLIFGMARAKMLPTPFAKIHHKYKTPGTCILFVMIVCCICPFFGREVISWVVDMCSVGTAFGYFFTCASAFILLKKYGDPEDENRIHPAVALGGCLIAVVILLLLIVPGSPAFMAPQSFIALAAWVILGFVCYHLSKKNFVKLSKREMDFLVLGNVQVIRHLRRNVVDKNYVEAELGEKNQKKAV